VERIIVIGGGGHAKVVVDALRAGGVFEPLGVLDLPSRMGEEVLGVPVVGGDEDLPRLVAEGVSACVIALGSTGDPAARVRLFDLAKAAGCSLPVVVHPRAWVSPAATLEEGVFVAANASVGPGSVIGACAIVNTGAVVDHDCRVGRFAHIAPGAALSGMVEVGDRSHIGTGSAVKQGVRIGAGSVVGVGSTVVDDIDEGVIAYGNPCRPVWDRPTEGGSR